MKKSMLDVIKTGKKYETEHFIFYVKHTENLRIGFRFSSTFAKTVTRNRIKRIFRKLIRENVQSGDLVIRAKGKSKILTQKDVEQEWKSIAGKIL